MDIDKQSLAIIAIVLIATVLIGAVVMSSMGDIEQDPNESPTQSPDNNTHEGAMNTPDQDKAIDIVNDYNQTSNVSITVVDENNQTVHQENYTVSAESTERDLWSISELNRTGINEYSITAEWQNQSQTVDVRTNQCYGDTFVELQEGGTLYVYYAIC